MAKEIKGKLRAEGRSFGIVVSRFNEFIGKNLLEGALDCLRRHGGEEEKMAIYWVPGSFEVPPLAKKLAESGKFDSVICLGALIRGDTPHFDYLASEVAKGLARVSLDTGVPTVFGVITADTTEQAIERAGTKAGNKGWDAAVSAMEMVDLFSQL